jgi:hypothetical protein
MQNKMIENPIASQIRHSNGSRKNMKLAFDESDFNGAIAQKA